MAIKNDIPPATLEHDNPEFQEMLREACDSGAGSLWLTYMRMAYSLGSIAADKRALERIADMRKGLSNAV